MRWTAKLGAAYLEVGRHKFRVWDNGPMFPEPVHRLPCLVRPVPDDEAEEMYEKIVDFMR